MNTGVSYLNGGTKRMQAFITKFALLGLIALCSGCSSLFYYPSSQLFYPPEKNDLKHHEIEMLSPDGEHIYAWFFAASENSKKKPRGTIVQFHGNAENMTSHYASLVWLVREGYNLFTFDYRGYGKSTGKPNQKGTNIDANLALNKAYEMHQKYCTASECSFIIYGQSLGGVIAMRGLDDFQNRSKVKLIVMDSTFMSYKNVAQQKLASFFLTWILSPLGQILVSDTYESTASVENNKTPLLVIHDADDPVMNFEHGFDLYKTAQCRKDMWVTDFHDHVGIFALQNQIWRNRFLKYLQDY